MIIVGLAGMKGVGKTTVAKHIKNFYKEEFDKYPKLSSIHIYSFGYPLKKEVSYEFNIDFKTLNSEQGKNKIVKIPEKWVGFFGGDEASIREILQRYGTDYRRTQDPEYWNKRINETLLATPEDSLVLVDDVRFRDEVDFLLNKMNLSKNCGLITKICPYPGYKKDSASKHISENDLNKFVAWDKILCPEFGGLKNSAINLKKDIDPLLDYGECVNM